MARPSKYRVKYCKQAEKLCHLGAIDRDLADFFGVSEKTLNKWKQDYPAFLQSLKRSKEIADSKVVRSLYERANGYSHPDVHISNYQGKITITNITKHYPPSEVACIYWLNNRDGANWRARPDDDGSAKLRADFLELMRLASVKMD